MKTYVPFSQMLGIDPGSPLPILIMGAFIIIFIFIIAPKMGWKDPTFREDMTMRRATRRSQKNSKKEAKAYGRRYGPK